MLPSETMIWQPEFTDKTLSRKPGAVHTVKETTAGEMLAACFVIFYSGVLLFILYFCFSALTDLQKPDDERKSDERNEDE